MDALSVRWGHNPAAGTAIWAELETANRWLTDPTGDAPTELRTWAEDADRQAFAREELAAMGRLHIGAGESSGRYWLTAQRIHASPAPPAPPKQPPGRTGHGRHARPRLPAVAGHAWTTEVDRAARAALATLPAPPVLAAWYTTAALRSWAGPAGTVAAVPGEVRVCVEQ